MPEKLPPEHLIVCCSLDDSADEAFRGRARYASKGLRWI